MKNPFNSFYLFCYRSANNYNRISLLITLLITLNGYAQNIPFADIHSHVCLKAFHSRHTCDYDNWDKIKHDCSGGNMANWIVKGTKGVPQYSQANLEANAKGNVRVVGWSMTPLELQYNNIRILKEKKKGHETMACVTGIKYGDYHFHKKGDVDYFPIILENIEFVKYGQFKTRKINGKDWSYEIVKNKKHLEELIQAENKVAVVLNIEGGNILGRSLIHDDVSEEKEYHELVLNNLRRLKGSLPLYDYKNEMMEYPILSLGINHFFYNGLGGQANPFKPLQHFVFRAGKGNNEPISPLGKKVIQLMISEKEGRRIVPDVKHMSLQSRQWYYELVNQEKEKGSIIPVMFSHAAVAGMSEKNPHYLKKDKPKKYKKIIYNNWTINLSDEDIKMVHETNGIIGLILDRFRLVGGVVEQQILASTDFSEERKELYLKSIALNILYIVKLADDKKGWNHVCIGSDFDGAINSFEMYDTAEKMPLLKKDLEAFFANPPTDIFGAFSKKEIKELMHGYSAEEIMNKLFSSNAIEFYLNHLPE